ncbi:MAG: fluoride efflux transporter CrcB [Pseudomonadota bacterium]
MASFKPDTQAMSGLMSYLMVAAGGALGASLRFGATQAATKLFGHGFPAGTMVVNIAGSLAMGLLIAWLAARAGGDGAVRLFFATGVLGGFTTFSAFSLDAFTLYERGDMIAAAVYVAASVLLSLLAIAAGFWLGRSLFA